MALDIDKDLALKARTKGCPHCSGTLHAAPYARKGRAGPVPVPDGWADFYGLCCSREGCRRRVRPDSVRFAGRSPHFPLLILLAQLLSARGSQRRIADLRAALGVSERTVHRWLEFWDRVHARSRWWRERASLFSLSGLTLDALWNELAGRESASVAAQNFLMMCLALWNEVPLCGGAGPPAEVA